MEIEMLHERLRVLMGEEDPFPGALAKKVKYALSRHPEAVRAAFIVRAVENTTDVSEVEMKQKSREIEKVKARFLAMYLLKTFTKLPLRVIGVMFGQRHYTTVIHSVADVKNNWAVNNDWIMVEVAENEILRLAGQPGLAGI